MKKLFIFMLLFFIFIPAICYADDYIEEPSEFDVLESIETSSKINDTPIINARHMAILDRNSKQIIYGKNETKKCKMASTTKIMTAIIVIENSNLNDIVTISSKSAGTGGSRLGLSTNDKITVEDLLYGLMMRSRK